MDLDRRALLTGGAALASAAVIAPVPVHAAPPQDDFAALRARWVSLLTGNGVASVARAPYAAIVAGVAENARQWWTNMADPGNDPVALWDDPFSKLAEREYNTRVSTDRLRVIALAWATPGSRFSDRSEVADRLVDALAWLERNRYSILIERYGNWWEWEIGIPLALLDLLILLREPLAARQPGLHDRLASAIDRFTPQAFAGTAANRVWRSHVVMLRAIATDQQEPLVAARDAIPTTFGDVLKGDGFHRDGSFIQHDELAYTGGYGRDLLTRSALLFYLLDGSPWAVARERVLPLRRRVLTAFAPLMYRGAIMDMVRGRNLSRANLSDIASGQTITIATLYLAAVLKDDGLKALAKGWIAGQRGSADILTYNPKLPAYWLTPHMAWLIVQAIGDRRVAPAAESVGTTSFAEMDRMVHRRPHFTLALAMNSARIRNLEIGNGENLTGWYAGWGATTVYRADRPNYADDYWPTVDPYRIPGTTLDKRPRTVGQEAGRNQSAQVGVLATDGIGLAAMFNRTDADSFTARASWLAVGDVVLCLGSGIRSTAGEPVETIIANEMTPGLDSRLIVDGQARPLTPGAPLAAEGARWAHLGPAGGVILPQGGRLRALAESRTHAWSEINRQGASPTDPRTRNYLTLWLDHGARPAGSRYAYLLLPAASAAQTRVAATRPPLQVDACTDELHLAHGELDGEQLVAAVFWQAGRTPDGMSATGPLLVTLRRRGPSVTLSVADPLPVAGGTISLVVPISGLRPVALDPAMVVAEGESGAVVTIARADLRGRTVSGTFAA